MFGERLDAGGGGNMVEPSGGFEDQVRVGGNPEQRRRFGRLRRHLRGSLPHLTHTHRQGSIEIQNPRSFFPRLIRFLSHLSLSACVRVSSFKIYVYARHPGRRDAGANRIM